MEQSINTVYFGIDNGPSGTIGVISSNQTIIDFIETPSFSQQDYTKRKKNISRINSVEFVNFIEKYANMVDRCFAVLERPMINPTRFVASICAARAFESELSQIEYLQSKYNLSYQFIDSKEWQKNLLPSGLVGSDEQKKASVDIGCRLFPQFKDLIVKHKDADGLLIAEHARRKNL